MKKQVLKIISIIIMTLVLIFSYLQFHDSIVSIIDHKEKLKTQQEAEPQQREKEKAEIEQQIREKEKEYAAQLEAQRQEEAERTAQKAAEGQ